MYNHVKSQFEEENGHILQRLIQSENWQEDKIWKGESIAAKIEKKTKLPRKFREERKSTPNVLYRRKNWRQDKPITTRRQFLPSSTFGHKISKQASTKINKISVVSLREAKAQTGYHTAETKWLPDCRKNGYQTVYWIC